MLENDFLSTDLNRNLILKPILSTVNVIIIQKLKLNLKLTVMINFSSKPILKPLDLNFYSKLRLKVKSNTRTRY